MVSFEKNIANLVPGMMSLSLLSRSTRSLDMFPKRTNKNNQRKYMKKNKVGSQRNLIKDFVDLNVGLAFIGPTSNLVAGI